MFSCHYDACKHTPLSPRHTTTFILFLVSRESQTRTKARQVSLDGIDSINVCVSNSIQRLFQVIVLLDYSDYSDYSVTSYTGG